MRAARIVIAGIALIVMMRSAVAAPLPGPAPQRRVQSAEAANRQCEGCHVEIAAEWRQSFHRGAYTDPAFHRAEQLEPRPFCRACHAPEADPSRPAVGWAKEAGVACVTCHLIEDRIISGSPQRLNRAPHPVVYDPRLSGDGACRRCHEFGFPDGQARVRPEFMQSTIREHARSNFADRACASCHMPRVGSGRGHLSHRFAGGHDEALLRRSIRVSAERSGPHALRLRLIPNGVGHALPTGDLLRRIVVTVFCTDSAGAPWRVQRLLTRHFSVEEQRPGTHVTVTRSDDRVMGPTDLLFTLPADRCREPPQFRVTYERVLVPAATRGLDDAILDGQVLLAGGPCRIDSDRVMLTKSLPRPFPTPGNPLKATRNFNRQDPGAGRRATPSPSQAATARFPTGKPSTIAGVDLLI